MQRLAVRQLVQLLPDLRFHKFRRVFHDHPPGNRVIYNRQLADHASGHKIFLPSPVTNCTMVMLPASS